MNKIPLIIDTDPGIDDAVAIAFALHNENIDVKLITTVCGNVSLDNVTNNALKLVDFWEKNIPVAKGAEGPMIEKFVDAKNVHGESGMNGFDFENSTSKPISEHAVLSMMKILKNSDEPVTIMAIGPLTNIALLFLMYPEIKNKIKELVIMGGSLTRGNKTVMGEFNIATDPEAAKIVFSSGVKMALQPVDVGWKAILTKEQIDSMKSKNKTSELLYKIFQNYRGGSMKTGLKMYDACAIAYITKPEMFTIENTFIDVETQGDLTRGTTLIDLRGYLNQKNNINVCTDVNVDIFNKWFEESLEKCK